MSSTQHGALALSSLRHDHSFDAGNQVAERGSRIVMWITAVMMVGKIAAG